MKTIQRYEDAISARKTGKDTEQFEDICWPVFRAYERTRDEGLEEIDFSDSIDNATIPAIVSELVRHGVTRITVSSGFSNLLDFLAVFENYGCKVQEMVKITTKPVGEDRRSESRNAVIISIPSVDGDQYALRAEVLKQKYKEIVERFDAEGTNVQGGFKDDRGLVVNLYRISLEVCRRMQGMENSHICSAVSATLREHEATMDRIIERFLGKVYKDYRWVENNGAVVVVEVETGMVTGVYSNRIDTSVEILDHDCQNQDEIEEIERRSKELAQRIASGELKSVL